MSNEDDIKDIDEAELLLPWYVAGTLSDADTAKVEAWLAEAPEAEAHLARAREEMEITVAASEEIPMPRSSAVNDVMAAIGADPGKQAATGGSFLMRLWEMLSPRFAMAGAAALALLVVAQGITIGVMVNERQAGTRFETASGPAAETVAAGEVTALIAFQPDTPLADISRTLSESNLRIIDGPNPGGVYRVAAADTEEGRAALEELAGAEMVRFFSGTD